MTRLKYILAAGVVGIALVVLAAIFHHNQKAQPPGYIFDNTHPISLAQVKQARKAYAPGKAKPLSQSSPTNADKNNTMDEAQDLYKGDGLVNYDTLRYLRHLEHLFGKSKDIASHLEAVRQYLLSHMPLEKANQVFDLYKRYLKCEMDLAKAAADWGQPTKPEQYLELLAYMQEFRRNQLGPELADALFGPEVKAKEYAIRRSIIISDKNLYGEQKELQIQELNKDMWGVEASDVEQVPKPYQRYREKLTMYAKNFSEMTSESEKKELDQQFRSQIFSPEVVKRLDAVDTVLEKEKQTEADYYVAQSAILNNPEMKADEKQSAIKKLQDETFKDQADAFRRREAYRKGLEKLKHGGE